MTEIKRKRRKQKKRNRRARKSSSEERNMERRMRAVKEVRDKLAKGESRCRIREELRREARHGKKNVGRRRCVGGSTARLTLLRTLTQEKQKRDKKRMIKGGTWNVRSLGAVYGPINQFLKMQCVIRMCERRRWSSCVLTDITFDQNGARGYESDGGTWTLVIHGKVGFMLNAQEGPRC